MDEEIEIEPDLPIFPPLEMDMIVDESPIALNNDDKNEDKVEAVPLTWRDLADYKEEMLKNDLVESDVEYFTRAYKSLEEVKFIKIHCSGCDKHMGSAPNEINNRYQHPILKVLLCAKCFQFYCSGEFEKGEDGSELYCRWCGEGGLVYCCTKCPFVFCKNCITRNLGRGTARIIENTEYWVCFSCNPWQISRHRATYWAIQKYSEEMIAQSKITGDVSQLEIDSNICCQGKKRSEPCEKTRTPQAKKPKVVKVPFETNTLLQNALINNSASTSKGKKTYNNISVWQPPTNLGPEDEVNSPSTSKGKKSSNNVSVWQPLANAEPEDEVICTPDIIPIDESPPSSPFVSTPPPLIPYIIQQQSVKLKPQQPIVGKGKIVPINIKNLQNSFQSKFFTPITQLVTNPVNTINLGLLNQKEGLRIVHHSSSPTLPTPIKIAQPPQNDTNKTAETSPEAENDWFDKAVVECAEATEYVSTKISGLASVHSRAHKSERLMEELHNTLQTYMHVAIDKMRKIKRNMQLNFEKERNKMMNPFAKTLQQNITHEDSSSQGTQSASEDDNFVPKEDDYSTQDTDSTVTSLKTSKRKRKSKLVHRQESIPPIITKIERVSAGDDMLFDMDVTNESDEEMESRTSSSIGSNFQTEEVINIISSDDDSDIEEVTTNKSANTKAEENKIVESTTEMSPNNDTTNKEQLKDKTDIEDKINHETENKTDKNINEDKTIVEETIIEKQEEEADKTLTEEADKTLTEENQTKIPDSLEELVKKVEIKFNIKNISSKDLLNYLSPKVILYNNRRAQKKFSKVSTSETKLKQFDVVETIQELLGTEWQQVDQNEKENQDKYCNMEEEPCDVEEMLGTSVVLRSNKSFGDEFSRFIGKSSESDTRNIQSCDEEDSENEDISNANNVETKNGEMDKMSDDSELDDAELFFNKDNESLSLPPDGIGDSIATNNIFATKETESSDLVLDSGILALKQMAENCVNPTVELRQASTECNG